MRVLIAALVMAVALASAEAKHKERWILGAGASSCGKWSATINYDADPGHKSTYFQWLLGYLSAKNSGTPALLKQGDSDTVLAWMNNYCSQHPLDDIFVAADVLVDELVKRANGN
jgi:hypothetical protein